MIATSSGSGGGLRARADDQPARRDGAGNRHHHRRDHRRLPRRPYRVRWLFIIFGMVMGYSAVAMLRKRRASTTAACRRTRRWAALRLHGPATSMRRGTGGGLSRHAYADGLALMYVAGVVSGLLGIGSGALKVPAMDLAMRLPIKVSTATSNFMIGVTAAAKRRASILPAATSTPSSPRR